MNTQALSYDTEFITGPNGGLIRVIPFDNGYKLILTKNRIKMSKRDRKVKFIKFLPKGEVTESMLEKIIEKILKFIRYGKLK